MKPLGFNEFYVIECLRIEEQKTGQLLFNDIIKRRFEQKGMDDNCELISPTEIIKL
ncbi:hypothetical protein D9M68_776590 [compost metagenome]